MKASMTNKTRGVANVAQGNVKIAAGKLTNKRLLEAKGRAQKIAGKIQNAVGRKQESQGD